MIMRIGSIACSCAVAAVVAGCPAPPRPQALIDLALMVDSQVAAQAASRAPEAMDEARALRARAESAWEDGDLGLSADLAALAQVKLRTAVALARQSLARERTEDARRTVEETEAAYREIEVRRIEMEPLLARLWEHREAARERGREMARRVEEEALGAERLGEAERAAWDARWRAGALMDVFAARLGLEQALMLGVAEAFPEAARMAVEAVDTAEAAVTSSPFRIARPLADYAVLQADEMRFRMVSLAGEEAAGAYAGRVAEMAREYRTGFDPPFHVRADPAAVVLVFDAKEAEIEIAFPESVGRALADLAAKWTADPDLLCLVMARSLDPECGEDCTDRMRRLAQRFTGAVGAGTSENRARIRSLATGFVPEEDPPPGVSRFGAMRLEIHLFPAVDGFSPGSGGGAGVQTGGR